MLSSGEQGGEAEAFGTAWFDFWEDLAFFWAHVRSTARNVWSLFASVCDPPMAGIGLSSKKTDVDGISSER